MTDWENVGYVDLVDHWDIYSTSHINPSSIINYELLDNVSIAVITYKHLGNDGAWTKYMMIVLWHLFQIYNEETLALKTNWPGLKKKLNIRTLTTIKSRLPCYQKYSMVELKNSPEKTDGSASKSKDCKIDYTWKYCQLKHTEVSKYSFVIW